jgi:hypothetical protein
LVREFIHENNLVLATTHVYVCMPSHKQDTRLALADHDDDGAEGVDEVEEKALHVAPVS